MKLIILMSMAVTALLIWAVIDVANSIGAARLLEALP